MTQDQKNYICDLSKDVVSLWFFSQLKYYVGWCMLSNNYKFKEPWTWWTNWAFHLFLILKNLLILYFNLLKPYVKHVFDSDFLYLKQKLHLIQ